MQDDKDNAIADCSEAIDLNDKYLKAILRRAQLYEDTDKPHEALKDFERILELDPKHIESIVAVRVSLKYFVYPLRCFYLFDHPNHFICLYYSLSILVFSDCRIRLKKKTKSLKLK